MNAFTKLTFDHWRHPATPFGLLFRSSTWAGDRALPGARLAAALVAMAWLLFLAPPAAASEGRIALVLGAETYQDFKPSRLTTAQSEALAEALKSQGFDVTLVANPVNAAARAAVSEFSRKAPAAEFALIVAAGHFATFGRQSFFLPSNVRVRRATDLFSRGLSAASLADIVGRAKAGAVAMMVTVPDISSAIAGISARPDLANRPADNVVVAFSSSSKVPVSGVDQVSLQAMKDLIEVAKEQPITLAALIDGASAGGTGRVFGTFTDRNLSEDAAPPAVAAPIAPAQPDQETVAKAAEQAAREAEAEADRKARELAEARQLAETRAGEAEKRAREAEARAREAEARAQRELAAAKAAQEAAAAAAREAAAQPATPEPPAATNVESLQVVEALLGREQRRTIQRILRTKGLYDGPIDAIFGDRTRVAIKAFQKQNGAEETGYLTPNQFQKLVESQ